ncbi:Replicase polyprotein 1ab [Frankliniella fusca]|uniref:Replicase polyprotein 1ab n=1 Tax=Frankliniella fusca TaxID=407009 RepID=A0AAE1HR89_9NEOP|nr:Replicase polyprotein 1ab [Frankliniella fusca]
MEGTSTHCIEMLLNTLLVLFFLLSQVPWEIEYFEAEPTPYFSLVSALHHPNFAYTIHRPVLTCECCFTHHPSHGFHQSGYEVQRKYSAVGSLIKNRRGSVLYHEV